MSRGLKVTFLIHAILGTIMSLGFLLVPDMVASLYGFTTFNPAGLARLYGAFALAVSVSSWLGARASDIQRVEIVVVMELWLTVVAALVVLYGLLFEAAPVMMWSSFAIFLIFAVLFFAFYPRGE